MSDSPRPRGRRGRSPALAGPWLDFGLGDQEWRFEGAAGAVSFAMGDPERTRAALARRALVDAAEVAVALAALVIEARAAG